MPDELPDILWLTHLAATLFLVGLIWVVQVVHYPLFAHVGAEQFHGYWRVHTRPIHHPARRPVDAHRRCGGRAAFCVAAARLVDAGAGDRVRAVGVDQALHVLIRIPLHERLGRRFDPAALRRLVLANWFRTAA